MYPRGSNEKYPNNTNVEYAHTVAEVSLEVTVEFQKRKKN